MKPDFNKPHFKLHPDDQGVDRIEIDVVPRFKTSGLSGDEWRVSGRILMFRKGELVGERSMSNVESCVNALPWLWMTLPEWTKGPLYSGSVIQSHGKALTQDSTFDTCRNLSRSH